MGWGEDPGFEIEQMEAYVTFPAVSGLDGAEFAIVFEMTNPGGAQIVRRGARQGLRRVPCSFRGLNPRFYGVLGSFRIFMRSEGVS